MHGKTLIKFTRNYIHLRIFFTRQPCQGFNLNDFSETDSDSFIRFLIFFNPQPAYIPVLGWRSWWHMGQKG